MANVYCDILLTLFCVLVLNHTLLFSAASAELHHASEFSRYTVIEPKFYHGREKREIFTTKEENGKHAEYLSITYKDDNKNYILDLQLNKKLIPKSYSRTHQKNGERVVTTLSERNVENCNYHGQLRGVPDSWAALSTCNERGFTGIVYNGNEIHYFDKSSIDNLHYLYKQSDLVNSNQTCGYEENRHFKHKRNAEPIRGPLNASRLSRYVEFVMLVDNAKYKELGEDLHKVEQYVMSIVNIVNGLYAPLNIYIALVGIEVCSEFDVIKFSSSADTTLVNFLHYRQKHLLKQHPNDNAQLLTKFTFENGVIARALKGPICTTEYSGGIVVDQAPLGLLAVSVAHTMGHNFGMEHDLDTCDCPEAKCIMGVSSSLPAARHWSSCSLEYLALAFHQGMDYCLRNKPDFLLDSPSCGNGFVESGEDCDCGLPENCNNPCCNATSCMFRDNATCATGECCDFEKCSFKSAGGVCRSADYECDLPEYCTGTSEYCPNDVFKLDSELCADGQAHCYQGSCRTPSDQCKLLWGETGTSADEECYSLNTKGTRHGNCGYNAINQPYFLKCNQEDVLCGRLQCNHLNDRLEFGMESVSILSVSFISHEGAILPCRSAIIDLGIGQIDPGLTPDGSKCGDSKMCMNQKCVLVSDLRNSSNSCPNNCNGNGVCNSLGHCHCNSGFAPPLCQSSGFGGSQDSGPILDPNTLF